MAVKQATANSGGQSSKRRGKVENLKPWPKGQSGNPAGAPKRGESWAEIIKRIGEMTDAEFMELKRNHPTQKQQAIMAVYMALKNDPQPGVFNAIMDRAEGKVADKTELTGKDGGPIELNDIQAKLLGRFAAADVEGAADSVPGSAAE